MQPDRPIAAQLDPLTPGDAPAASALLAEAYPHRAYEPERWGRMSPNDEQRWAVRAPDGTLRAYAALWRVHAGQFRVDLIVAPPSRGRGLGSALLDEIIVRARALGARSLQARPYAEDARALLLLDDRRITYATRHK